MGDMLWGWQVDETGSESWPLAGFGISGVEPSGSATTVLVSKMNLRELGCEDGRWMELAQDRVQWQALVLAVLSFLVLLPECCFFSWVPYLQNSCRPYENCQVVNCAFTVMSCVLMPYTGHTHACFTSRYLQYCQSQKLCTSYLVRYKGRWMGTHLWASPCGFLLYVFWLVL
jgi:hypothetical protein